MDSDDLMPDTMATSQTTAPDSVQGDGSTAPGANNGNTGPGAWNTKKFRDEYETVKSRLLDAKFSSANYPDPLLPSESHVRKLSAQAAATAETERFLKDVIAKAKAGMA